jgi:hypothetical protein
VQLPVLASGELGADLYLIAHPAAQHSPADTVFRDEMLRLEMYDCITPYAESDAAPGHSDDPLPL